MLKYITMEHYERGHGTINIMIGPKYQMSNCSTEIPMISSSVWHIGDRVVGKSDFDSQLSNL